MDAQINASVVTEQFLTPEEVSRITRRSLGTLANWRTLKRGPSFIRNAGRVLYLREDVEDFINTSEVIITVNRNRHPKKKIVYL